MAVGIELECGGYLGRPTGAGQFVHPDTKRVVAPEEVYKDQHGVGWHMVTPYQLARLEEILQALEALMPLPFPYTVLADGGYAANNCAYYAPVADPQRTVGHCTLDPVNKTDPGPQVMAWLADRKHD